MSSKFTGYIFVASILLMLIMMSMVEVQAQETFEPDSEPVQPPQPSNRRRYDRFNQWMKVINDFFTEGNWLNGGPSNLIEYITRTLAKLLDVLMHRRGPPVTAPVDIPSSSSSSSPSNPTDDYDDTFEYKVRDSNALQRQRQPSLDRYRNQKTLNLEDIIRMIPTNQLKFDRRRRRR
ncbi:uncharacterized protein LOC113789710 [Dermatophagoides pteronyssinus]|uniref:Uncharacterized protein LOC113789710 n=2 Tax=Dermatophagoides pteronyssinus TaxID=6956 RepID=A0A6P6XT45_DERPT|nr:uncharacterized protein LOC113789710 [Dermatophagoides pteronyssinus]KAH9425881.1 hypothetical protein DERP_005100 [Dermatophagoides pteronyssinus]